MLIIGITAALMAVTGTSVWLAAHRWTAFQLAPRVKPEHIRGEVRRHPRAAALVDSRLDPNSTTGLALTAGLILLVAGVVAFGLLVWMIRTNIGFARFDLSAARFAAAHASPASMRVLRDLSVLGGAAFLGPFAAVMCVAVVRRERLPAVACFLALTVGGQFAVVDLIKWIVDRTRPDIDRLTGFSGPSFPSGHAAASAASFAAFALLAGIGRSSRAKAILAGIAVALAVGIASSRVFLGVHWLTDVLAGLAFGWAWFAICSIAFGGRLLRFGAPAEQAQQALRDRPAALPGRIQRAAPFVAYRRSGRSSSG
jgi:membrane-associated phospholipid phosphatase